MYMPKSRDLHAKIPSTKAILLNFGIVSVKGLNRYELILFENQMKKTSKENKRRRQVKKGKAHHGKICFSEKCVEDLPDG